MRRCVSACLALLFVAAGGVRAASEDPAGFRLTATADDWPRYFPGLLANGYLSTLTAPRGTEGNAAELVALMDYAKDDIARPAGVPGWTAVDYSAGPTVAGQFWMNQVPLDAAHFRDYTQTLDLREATLHTRYRYVDGDGQRSTGVDVTTLVSQAAPHLAATRVVLTPAFDGEVQLSLAFDLWAPTQPRLPLARLTGEQMQEAVAAQRRSLTPVPPATPDRAALWYPGDVHVHRAEGDAGDATLWLDGRAEQGLTMAMAAAIALPPEVRAQDVRVYRSAYRLALNVRLKVKRGTSYAFTKFVAASREGWGGDGQADLALAKAARMAGFDALRRAHVAAWNRLWQADIRIDGDEAAQRLVHADLYYLLSNVAPGTAWPVGACAMTTGYTGHAFWDSDSWVFPALLLQHPLRARSLVTFRSRTLPAAQARARARGLPGAMYPWEADPEYGTEQVPHFAHILSDREIHVTADVAIAQWQYYLATGDRTWLREHGWPVLREVARFWTARAERDADGRWHIRRVTSVSEPYTDVDDDTYTNASASRALAFADAAARVLGETADPHWKEVADHLVLPMSADGRHHVDFDPATPHRPGDGAADTVPLLAYPSMDWPMDEALRRADFTAAVPPLTDPDHVPNSMGLAPTSIAAAAAGEPDAAVAWFHANVTADVIKPPFNVRTETATNNTGYFLTAGGGLLQNVIFGFTGLRLRDGGLVPAYAPVLPPRWRAFTLHRVQVRGRLLDITVRRDAQGRPTLDRRDLGPAPPSATAGEVP